MITVHDYSDIMPAFGYSVPGTTCGGPGILDPKFQTTSPYLPCYAPASAPPAQTPPLHNQSNTGSTGQTGDDAPKDNTTMYLAVAALIGAAIYFSKKGGH
jgi:hypothetical protein